MSLHVEIQKGSEEELQKVFLNSVQESWISASQKVEGYFEECLKRILFPRVDTWELSKEIIEKYPFLRNKFEFIQKYIKCFDVIVSDNCSITFTLSPDKVSQASFPVDIGEMLEYGNLDFPSLPHFRDVVMLWQREYASKFADEVVLEAASRYAK